MNILEIKKTIEAGQIVKVPVGDFFKIMQDCQTNSIELKCVFEVHDEVINIRPIGEDDIV